MPAHAMHTFGIAEGDGEWETLAVTSRDMLEAERTWKGFSAQTFFANVTTENMYRLAFTTLRRRGRIAGGRDGLRYDDFVDGWSVAFGDPEGNRRRLELAQRMAAEGRSADEIQAAVIAAHLDSDDANDEAARAEAEAGDPDEADKGDAPFQTKA